MSLPKTIIKSKLEGEQGLLMTKQPRSPDVLRGQYAATTKRSRRLDLHGLL